MKFVTSWAGVDYLRCSYKPGSDLHRDGGRDRLNLLAMSLTGIRRPELTMREWRTGGYVGVSYPSVSWGERPNGALMLQVSGANANDAVQVVPVPDRVSRIDVQATVECGESVSRETLEEIHRYLMSAYENPTRKGRRAIPGRIEQERLTVTSGKRGRQGRYVRCYDSAYVHRAEGSAYKNTIRLEIEVTGDQAMGVYDAISAAKFDPDMCRALVAGELNARGVTVVLGGAPADMPKLPPRGAVDDERTIEWLKRSVRPALARLQERGHTLNALLSAMGLETFAICAEG